MQLDMLFRRDRVKALHLEALRLGSVLVDHETCVIVESPRGKEGWSKWPWFKVKGKRWLYQLHCLMTNRKRLIKDQAEELTHLDAKHDEALERLRTRQREEREQLQWQHRQQLKVEDRVMAEHLFKTQAFIVHRDGERGQAGALDVAAMFEDQEGDIDTNDGYDDIPF